MRAVVEMLEIRQSQAQGFAEGATAGFVRRVVAHLRQKLPDRVRSFTDSQLSDWVRDVIARGAPFGLKSERQIVCLVDCEVLLGQRFYETLGHAWAKVTLQSTKLHPEDKAQLLLATACSLDRDKAAR
jgi:hypothetical protein